jgi:hypothetical protein
MPADQTTNCTMYCRQCGYQLTGLSANRCPECGRPFDPANPRTFRQHPRAWLIRRWARRIAWTAAILALCLGIPMSAVLGWFYSGWRAEQPAILVLKQAGRQEWAAPMMAPKACGRTVPNLMLLSAGPAWSAGARPSVVISRPSAWLPRSTGDQSLGHAIHRQSGRAPLFRR